jgi:hypothetical protein
LYVLGGGQIDALGELLDVDVDQMFHALTSLAGISFIL